MREDRFELGNGKTLSVLTGIVESKNYKVVASSLINNGYTITSTEITNLGEMRMRAEKLV